jgi:hypothetical protein
MMGRAGGHPFAFLWERLQPQTSERQDAKAACGKSIFIRALSRLADLRFHEGMTGASGKARG